MCPRRIKFETAADRVAHVKKFGKDYRQFMTLSPRKNLSMFPKRTKP